MSTIHLGFKALALSFALFWGAHSAFAKELKPFKDDLFAYPGILESRDNGDWIKVDYQKARDIHQRDEVPEVKVKGQYVSKWVTWKQSFDTFSIDGHKLDVFQVGKKSNQAFSIIFVHGRGGDRKLGATDDRFGGNFNRLKNLASDNGGFYIAPTITAFNDKAAADISALIRYLRKSSGGHPVFLACASMGSIICNDIARDVQTVSMLSGMIQMSAINDPQFETTAFYAAHLPIVFAHGTDDVVYPWQAQDQLYTRLHSENYPARFILFNTGSHGTPLRMLDWRQTLNWLLSRS